MRDVIEDVARLFTAGEPFGLATVVRTWKSAPRPAGASMAVGSDGEAVGSVSGGRAEGAVYDLAQEVVATGCPVLQRYGVTDGDAFAVGLTCGGSLDVFVEKVSARTWPDLPQVVESVCTREPVAVATVVSEGGC